jgi:hypothetical protein
VSGIGEMAYTVLLGWMRAVVDWVWAMVSGTGASGIWQWFLSQWRIWLVILIIGGLVMDWLMWVVRWRPYRLLFGRRRAPKAGHAPESWDSGMGYYAAETAVDGEQSHAQWTDMTLRTLSEIDPDWAGDVVIEEEPPLLHEDTGPYFTTLQEEIEAEADRAAVAPYEMGLYEDEDIAPEVLEEPEPEVAPDETDVDDEPPMYGRPGFWPGQMPFVASAPTPAPAPEPEKTRRRRRQEAKQARQQEPRTVTGKPAQPRGLRRFTAAQEEAIPGLPPLAIEDAFLPPATPYNPDFAPDEGDEYDNEPMR